MQQQFSYSIVYNSNDDDNHFPDKRQPFRQLSHDLPSFHLVSQTCKGIMLSAPLGALTPQCGSYFSRRRFFSTTPAGDIELLPQEEYYSRRRNTTPSGGTLLPQEEHYSLRRKLHHSRRRNTTPSGGIVLYTHPEFINSEITND